MEVKKKNEFPLMLSTSNRKLLPNIRQKLREKVPPISFNELRRMQIKFHEALLLELEESHHLNAYKFFNEIVQHDLNGSKVLTNNNELTEMIFNELKKAEYSTKDEEIETLLRLGRKIETMETSTRWLAGKIYEKTLANIENFLFSGTRIDAYTKYFYGKFLAEEKNFETSVQILEDSLKICDGNQEWIVEGMHGKLCCTLVADELLKSSMELSKSMRNKNPENSLKLASKALKIIRIYKIDDSTKKEVDCEVELGSCHEALNQFEKAQKNYEQAFELSKMFGLHQLALDVLLKTADFYKKSENPEKFDETLSRAKEHVKSNSNTAGLEGDILVMLGKFWVEQNDSKKALENYNKAIKFFEKSKELNKLRRLRILMAFPLAEDGTFDKLIYAILRSDKEKLGNNPYTQTLRKWQDSKQSLEQNRVEHEISVKELLDLDEITKVQNP